MKKRGDDGGDSRFRFDDDLGETIGVEEEFHIVSRSNGLLREGASTLLDTTADVEPELQRTMIETATLVCTDMASLRTDLVGRRKRLIDAASRTGLAVAASGCLPGSGKPAGRVYPKARYEWIGAEYQQIVREQQVCACQVHVGVPDRDLAVRVCRRVRAWLPVLLAMSASSPMFLGVDTGYASYRTIALSRWPTVGPPPDFDSAEQYDESVSTLVETGVVSDPGMIYYDARPSAHYPTVEIRIPDACPSVDDAVLLAALARALVVTTAAEDRAGEPTPRAESALLRAATWRAARSGLDGDLLDPVTSRPRPARDVVRDLLEHLRPALIHHGDWSLVLTLADDLWRRGTSAQRQREMLAEGATDADIVAAIVSETAAS